MDDNKEVVILEKECDKAFMNITNFDKWLVAIIITFIVFIIFSPAAFFVTNSITRYVGFATATKHGAATMAGLFIHAIVVLIIVRLLMH